MVAVLMGMGMGDGMEVNKPSALRKKMAETNPKHPRYGIDISLGA